MAVFLGAVVLNVSDVAHAADFWGKALDYVPQPDDPAFLAPRGGGTPRIHLDASDRTHLDLWVDRRDSDLETEVERLVALGARRVEWDYPPEADFVVLADPAGRLFCVIS